MGNNFFEEVWGWIHAEEISSKFFLKLSNLCHVYQLKSSVIQKTQSLGKKKIIFIKIKYCWNYKIHFIFISTKIRKSFSRNLFSHNNKTENVFEIAENILIPVSDSKKNVHIFEIQKVSAFTFPNFSKIDKLIFLTK